MAKQREEAPQTRASGDAPLPLWRNRDYLLLIGGQAVSDVGTEVSDLAYVLLILTITHSPAQVGIVGALELLPVLSLSLYAGVIIDRWDRKRVMLVCDACRALCLTSVVAALVLGHLTILQIYLVALIEATFSVFFDIADRACLRNVVPREQLSAASAQDQALAYTSALLGPGLSGALYSLGNVFPFLVDAISYLVSVFSLLFIKIPFQAQRQVVARASVWSDLKEGFQWLRKQPLLRFMTFMIGGLNVTAIGMSLIVVILAQQQHASSFVIGFILAVGSIGGIIGAMFAPILLKRLTYGQGISIVCWCTALILPLFALAPNLAILAIVLTLYLVWGRIMGVFNFSYRTALTPDAMQGRIIGISSLIVRGSLPIGIALTGALIQTYGVIPTVLIFAVYRLFMALIVTLNPHVLIVPPLEEIT